MKRGKNPAVFVRQNQQKIVSFKKAKLILPIVSLQIGVLPETLDEQG